nr:PREDICTED: uncharacterized protein LOC109044253 isoform X2 [Bemisia tabaci]XP_018917423.1 PREDICTED: uncharacterized protein LOC109044253 isoform X2 [Bemisia tabaci]XP_018917424.1 PREDICTED: uncharacterized protein LOC109044253 isoform X2 [Bemisia tabaci]XP_018917425.1 PREDICTED: uncharacterized protein LOC109044253 isoform X2 [Bemisia tabaci]
MTELRSCLKKRSHISLIPPPDPTSKTPYITMMKSSKKMRSTCAKTRPIRAALSLSPSLKKQNVRSKTKTVRRVHFTPDSFSTETEVDSPDSPPRMTYGRRIPYVGGYTRPEFSPDRELRLPCDEQLKSNARLVEVVATSTKGSKLVPSCSCSCSCSRGQPKTQRKRSYSSDSIMSFRSFFSPKMAPIKRIHSQTKSKEECEVRNQDPDEQPKKLGSLRRERSSSSDSNERFKSFFAPKMAPIKKEHPETQSEEKGEVRGQDPAEQLKNFSNLQGKRRASSDSSESFRSFFAPKMAPIKKIRPETVSEEKCNAQDHCPAELRKNFDRVQRKRSSSSDTKESYRSSFAPKMTPAIKAAEQLKNVGNLQRKRSLSSDSDESFKSFLTPKVASITKIHTETISKVQCNAQGHCPAEQQENLDRVQRKRSFSSDFDESYRSSLAPKVPPKEECTVQSNKKLEEKTVSSNFISSHKKSRNTISSLTKPPLTVQYKPAQQNNFSKFIVSQNFSLEYHDNKEYSLLGKVLTYFEVTSKRNFGKKALLPTPMDIPPIPLPYYIHQRR